MVATELTPSPAVAVVPAAGSGTRMGAPGGGKTHLALAGVPLIVHTLRGLLSSAGIARAYLVVAPAATAAYADEFLHPYGLADIVQVVSGGPSRQESVLRGLMACQGQARFVVVHDGARPLVTAALVDAALTAARTAGAATVAVPVTDTLKRSDAGHLVTASVDREWLWSIQTPQAFRLDLLIDAHLTARADGIAATDDASLVQGLGRPVQIVMGARTNIKVTTPDDLPIAEFLLKNAQSRPAS